MNSDPHVAMLVAVVAFAGVVLGAIFSFVGVAITAFFTSRNNNKNIFINTVTTERAKWRDELRNHAAEFCKLAYAELRKEEKVDRLRREELRILVRLRLNPNPRHTLDKNILETMSKLAGIQDLSADPYALQYLEIIESNVQALLKQEWEKSKKEARKGKLVSAARVV